VNHRPLDVGEQCPEGRFVTRGNLVQIDFRPLVVTEQSEHALRLRAEHPDRASLQIGQVGPEYLQARIFPVRGFHCIGLDGEDFAADERRHLRELVHQC
jgi:hypothetical protein